MALTSGTIPSRNLPLNDCREGRKCRESQRRIAVLYAGFLSSTTSFLASRILSL